MTSGPGALDPPVGGTFHFENLVMPPLPKTCPKMVLSDKGGSLCVKDVFAKKFFGAGRDSAGGALASVRRTSSNSARPTDGHKLRVVAPCTGSDCTPQGVIVMRAVRSAMLAAAVILALIIAGNRGFCNPNPYYRGPEAAPPRVKRKR
jgi:hypothetical protein